MAIVAPPWVKITIAADPDSPGCIMYRYWEGKTSDEANAFVKMVFKGVPVEEVQDQLDAAQKEIEELQKPAIRKLNKLPNGNYSMTLWNGSMDVTVQLQQADINLLKLATADVP